MKEPNSPEYMKQQQQNPTTRSTDLQSLEALSTTASALSTAAATSSTSMLQTTPEFITPSKTSKTSSTMPYQDITFSDQYALGVNEGISLNFITSSPTKRVTQLEAYTPERGRSLQNNSNNNNNDNDNNKSSNNALNDNNGDNGNNNSIMRTPARSITGQFQNKLALSNNPSLPPPLPTMTSTQPQQQGTVNSYGLPGSSPAFWRFIQLSSTPARANNLSPTKFSSPTISSAKKRKAEENKDSGDKSDGALGDLKDVDLTRGFKKFDDK